MQGPESHDYAVSLANSAGVDLDLGRFDIAEAKICEAIAYHGRISNSRWSTGFCPPYTGLDPVINGAF